MKTNLFKKVFAFVLAMSMVTIPAISHAGISETGNELFNLDLTKDYGTGEEATNASFSDLAYSLDELNAGKYVENGEIKTAQNPTVKTYDTGTPKFSTSDLKYGGNLSFTEDFTETQGITIDIAPITVGKFEIEISYQGYTGVANVGRNPLVLNGKTIIEMQHSSAGRACWEAEDAKHVASRYKLTLTRDDASKDWSATLKYGTYLSDTVTGTIAAADLPVISTISGTAWRGAANAGTTTNLSYKYIKATHYPVEYVTPSCDVTEIRTVQPSIDVSFTGAVNPDTISNITFKAGDENMVTGASLSEDGKTATLTLKNLVDGQIYTLDVPSTVKDVDGVGVTALTKSVTAKKAKNVLFDIDFSKDYGTEGDNTYTSEDLAEVHKAVQTTWNDKTGFTLDAENGRAKLVNDGAGSGAVGISLSTGEITSGTIAFDFKFYTETTPTGNDTETKRDIIINSNQLFNIAKNGQYYYLGDDTTKLYDSPVTSSRDLRIVVKRADTESDWSYEVYDKADGTLLGSKTLLAADYPSITTFDFRHDWLGTTVSSGWYLYSLKGEIIDTNAIYNIDFSNIAEGTYTTSEFNTVLGSNIMTEGANPISYVVENGVGKVYGTKAGAQVTATTNFEAIEKGCVAFDVNFNHEATGINNRQRPTFVLKSSKGATKYLITMSGDGSSQFYAAPSHLGDDVVNRIEFISGADKYAVKDRVEYNIRVVVMRADENSDWRVRMYDLDASTTAPILTTTLKATDFPDITNTYMTYWIGGSDNFSNMYIPLRKYSANYISMEEMSAVETMKVEDSTGAIITNLADETVVADGKVNVVADVNQTGGVLYAAIYDGDRIIDVNMKPVTTMGEYTIPFTVENPTASKSIKLFYWDLNASPITNTMDPLARH